MSQSGAEVLANAAALLEAAPDAMIVSDSRGLILLVNGQTERLFGYSREEVLGKAVEMLIPQRFRDRHVGHRDGYRANHQFRPMGSGLELYGLKKDGTEFPVEISLSPIRTDGGLWISAAVRDTTERKRLEKLAKLNTDRLLSAVESVQDAFALFDDEDRLILCNSAYRRSLFDFEGPVIGLPYQVVIDHLARHVYDLGGEPLEQFMSRRTAYRQDPRGAFDVRTKDGRSWRVTDRHTPEGGIVTTIWDLTDDMRRAHELAEARAAAEAASAAKSEFLSSMSHELRTPLNAVLGFAQLLRRDKRAPLDERQQGMLDHVIKGGDHLLKLIDEILNLARIESGGLALSIEPVQLPELLAEVTQTLAPMASRSRIRLTLEPLGDLPSVSADRTRLAQILLNYGSNAVKYARPDNRATISAESRGDVVRVVVSDSGPGIPVERRARIFQPFYRAGQEAGTIEGTGIGLNISKRLAEMMGGRVGFESELGRGSSFWVELPTAARPSPAAPVPAAPAEPAGKTLEGAQGPAALVLYVEDNPSNQTLMQAILAGFEGVRLLTAPTAELGIELARVHLPRLVLMDINLPGMSGYDALRRLKEWPETAATPVLALSASAMERDRERALASGFTEYLTKPIRVDELLRALEHHLGTAPR